MGFSKCFEDRQTFVGIVNRKVVLQSRKPNVPPEQIGTKFVKRADPDILIRCERGKPILHDFGGFVSEGERSNLRGTDPLMQQRGNTMRHNAGLPAPGTREHEKRTFNKTHRLLLRLV